MHAKTFRSRNTPQILDGSVEDLFALLRLESKLPVEGSSSALKRTSHKRTPSKGSDFVPNTTTVTPKLVAKEDDLSDRLKLLPIPSAEADQRHNEENGYFTIQANMARHILSKMIQLQALPSPARTYSKINLLIVGPASVALRQQTLSVLEDLLAFNSCDLSCGRTCVVNSCNLKRETGEGKHFLENLTNRPENLHLLVLDEFDWGAESGSMINKYLVEVVAALRQRSPRRLLVLMLSATPELLTDLPKFKDVTVEWLALAQNRPEYFATPTYRSVYDMNYELFTFPRGFKTQVKRSEHVRDEYINALENIRSAKPTIASRVIKSLSGTDNCAVVRLYRVDHAHELYEAYKRMKNKTFSCILFDPEEHIKASTLENTLIIVVARLQRGEVLTDKCIHYDIRARFVDGFSLHTVKQDIGRVAG
eukprot:TRINITY_DN7217_c0_g1_i1.p1 TRINITY_DN7217_c0_g1~~TRINITY_DN7217_c0_g1_i1.p1  ORF type:complete len:422 (-),score=60.26 TRINITY_DN7217_c0_g1_i1:325-1590(-)